MRFISLTKGGAFTTDNPYRDLLGNSPNLRVVACHLEPGEGEGEFTGAHAMPARAGQVQIMPVTEPHGLKAHTRLGLPVVIAPTL